MKGYILKRLLKAILSIFIVVSIVIVMIYKLIPPTKIFENDTILKKLSGDARTLYVNNKYDELGYLDFYQIREMCTESATDKNACMIDGSEEQKRVLDVYKEKGYDIEYYKTGTPYAIHNFNSFELLGHFYANLIKIDGPNAVKDDDNPTLERKYYWGKDNDGNAGLMCSGCNYKYQLYFNTTFPFIHQNVISFNFGNSYPTAGGVPVTQVISQGQGSQVNDSQTFPNGYTTNSPIIQSTCKYKASSTIDSMDRKKFDDNYADCMMEYESPSMINTSYIFGISSLILAYLIAIPAGILMARNKGKAVDKIGIVYINLLNSLPSLAFIFFMRQIGYFAGLPSKFPSLGFKDPRSYIMPILILAMLSTSGLMTWIRRYMIDQSNSDYVKFAKAKGLSQSEIFNRHILKNAIIPIVNGIPGSIILCISGAFITESAFGIPGMGKMLPDAITYSNNNMIICLVTIFSALSILSVLAGDVLMTLVDPRIKLEVKKGD